jgi:hypothetical protein
MVLTERELPKWFKYPQQFLRIVELGLLNLEPWTILMDEQLRNRFKGLQERYPDRQLLPFARREDNDDVACWEKDRGELIVIVHDFASPGYENNAEYDGFWEWFRNAVEDMIEYD